MNKLWISLPDVKLWAIYRPFLEHLLGRKVDTEGPRWGTWHGTRTELQTMRDKLVYHRLALNYELEVHSEEKERRRSEAAGRVFRSDS